MFRSKNFKFHYTSEEDDIYEDFYVPALHETVTYKRAVGYFSLGVLLNTPSALSELIEKNGKIKIIFAKLVSHSDLEQIQGGLEYNFEDKEIPSFQSIIEENTESLLSYRIQLLAYLFKTGHLEIKVALRRKGLFHQKIGILEDLNSDLISFNGSMNETVSALDPDLNSEEITVFKSWERGQEEYVKKHKADFEKLWRNESGDNTIVCGLPEAIVQEFNLISSNENFSPSLEKERRLIEEYFQASNLRGDFFPRVPKNLYGKDFLIRDHQREALSSWKSHRFNGILELATGTGKTITAIYALTRIAEKINGLSAIISVPYVDLADQWIKELRLFNINAIKCYGSRELWQTKLSSYVLRNNTEQSEFVTLVVVNKTLKSNSFQQAILDLDYDKTMFIGDECHHHGSKSFSDKLPNKAKFKLGLSATPFHYLDNEANLRLEEFYGSIVYSYSLYQAIENGILSPYEYHPIPIVLTNAESEEYHRLTDSIGKSIASSGSKNTDQNEQLQSLLMRRARLVGTASNKLTELKKLISTNEVPKHSLFYCSDGRVSDQETHGSSDETAEEREVKQRIAVAKILRSKGITASAFTATETRSQRTTILENFKQGEVNSLVAIKCLDEGIDIPACTTAYLLASSRNPRQFIQRRGRILRRAEGKEKAIIYDFVAVLPPAEIGKDSKEIDFLKNELARVADFAKHSLNPISSIKPLDFWLDKYDLFHLVV